MLIDFRYPTFAIGFHSGWSNEIKDPTKTLRVSKRVEVSLKKHPYKKIFFNLEKEMPLLIKTKKGFF